MFDFCYNNKKEKNGICFNRLFFGRTKLMFNKLNQLVSFIFFISLFNSIYLCKSTTSTSSSNVHHYNIPDPDCSGPFGLCTQEDKDRLGYQSIKKLHENMDDDRDGNVEIHETKEFMTEELQYKNGAHSEREQKFHGSDMSISLDEMWKSWKYSQVHNWSTDDLIIWVNEQVKLPKYADYFRRNQIDGQFLPRLALNENNYYSNVLQIKDPSHKKKLMIKAIDLVLFGNQQKPHNLIKDVLMITLLTLSIFLCIYLYSKHRQSLEQIKQMMIEFDKLTTSDETENAHFLLHGTSHHNPKTKADMQSNNTELDLPSLTSSSNLFAIKRKSLTNHHLNDLSEINLAKQKESENVKKSLENADNQLKSVELEKELEKVKTELKITKTRLENARFNPPSQLINLLTRTYESEKELFEYKFKIIEKEKEFCLDALNKVSKRQSGILGALKIAHSSTLEEVNHKLEILKREIVKCKSEKHDWIKRWNTIEELCNKNNETNSGGSSAQSNLIFFDSTSQEQPFIFLENGLILPKWQYHHRKFNKFLTKANIDNTIENKKVFTTTSTSYHSPTLNEESLKTSQKSNASSNTLAVFNHMLNISNNNNNINSNKLTNILATPNSILNNGVQNVNSNSPAITFDIKNNNIDLNGLNSKSYSSLQVIKSDEILQTNNNILNSNLNEKSSKDVEKSDSNVEFCIKNSEDGKSELINKYQETPMVKNLNFSSLVSSGSSSAIASSATAQTTTITTNKQKVARNSIIHKNDVFQFDDVESVYTNDLFFRNITPQSSIESEQTYRSSSIANSSIKNKNNNNKYLNAKQSIANFITPIFTRGTPGKNEQHDKNINGNSAQVKHKTLRPQSISSVTSSFSSKIKKKNPQAIMENGSTEDFTKNNINSTSNTNSASITSLERSNTFSKKLNSFKNLIKNPNKTSKNSLLNVIKSSSDNLSNQPSQSQELQQLIPTTPITTNIKTTTNNLYVNSSPNKQLTISSINNINDSSLEESNKKFTKTSDQLNTPNLSRSVDMITIPVSSTSTASFTITSIANGSKNHENMTKIVEADDKSQVKSKSKLFNFKLNNKPKNSTKKK